MSSSDLPSDDAQGAHSTSSADMATSGKSVSQAAPRGRHQALSNGQADRGMAGHDPIDGCVEFSLHFVSHSEEGLPWPSQ